MSKKLSLIELTKTEMRKVSGGQMSMSDDGGTCWCGCCYRECGGSSTYNNAGANYSMGINTIGCANS